MLKNILLASATLAFASPALAQSAETRAMSAQDLVTMPRVGGAAVSPDGTMAVYSVTHTDPDTLARSSRFMLLDLTQPGSPAMVLEKLGEGWDASFGPDGSLYYLADHAPGGDAPVTMQIFRTSVRADGRTSDPVRISDFITAFSGYRISPDGRRVLVWGDAQRDCAGLDCPADPAEALAGTGRTYDADEGFVRHWDTWERPGEYGRAFVYPLPARNGAMLGDPVAIDGPAIADAPVVESPVKPFGGGEELAWAADSASVFFAGRVVDKAEPTSTNLDIYRSALDGSAPVNLTAGNLATDTQPTPSPDGRWLAWLAMERPGYESDRLVIHLRDLQSGQVRALTDDFDRSFGSIAWAPDSSYIVATALDRFDNVAFRVDPATGSVTRLDLVEGNEGAIGSITVLDDGKLVFARSSIENPGELYLGDSAQFTRQLTNETGGAMRDLAPVSVDRFTFSGAGGDTVHGWIAKPAGVEGKLPAILYVHGGPQGSFSDGWSSRWNARTVASQGYAVIAVDFHGSTGYGQAFTDAINKDWGGKPLTDLKLGLAAALERDSQIDGTRACAMGASYGGYMMNWIAGNWSDRFDCLVQHDGLFDMRSFYYTTEELWFPRWDFGGSYAENSELYEKWNPVNYVQNWKTPMLVITGEKDFRVPYTQGIASFTALQEQDVPARLLVFPDENHWVLKPKNSLQWHEEVFGWLDRWLAE
jgi:dipeptidyl aminopeptidase/acylaminoacyl peptidase